MKLIRTIQQKRRVPSGSAIVETVIGLMILIPIVLVLIDAAAVVIVQTQNDKMAKACARAAAQDNTPGGGNAQNLANQTLSTQNNSSQLMSSPTVQVFWDNPQTGSVTCQTNVICNLPVPVPFINLSTIPFSARSTEPEINVLPQ